MGICLIPENKYKKNEEPTKKPIKIGDNKIKDPISESDPDQLYNPIVRINFVLNEENFIGTGFFIRFKIKNKIRYFLMTTYSIIGENLVRDKKVIKFDYREEDKQKNIEILLDRNKRYIKCYGEPLDVTLIEILDEDNIRRDIFLEPDLNYKNYKNGYNFYKEKSVNLLGYPQTNQNDGEKKTKTGKIINILNNSEFEFSFDTDDGNFGAPICLVDHLSVVGIHKRGTIDKKMCLGTFLGFIIDNIKNEIEDINPNNLKLLEKIKGINIIKILFSNLNEKIKLKTIKYNKKLQKINDINLNDYKNFSGRYIKYDLDGKGKEYFSDNGRLIYEGEYLNGERYGKGKEFNDDGEKKFVGEYLNGKRNGNGEEYYKNKLLFEGEYLNGKRSGFGKQYDYNCKLEFEGEYLNGRRHGEGKEYDENGKLIFEGEYLNGQRNGKGKEYNNNGILIFEGEYLNNKKWNGKGYDENEEVIFELNNGSGKIREYNNYGKLIFEGEYLNGQRNGKGKEYNYNGKLIFEGEYVNGKKYGKGKEFYYNGKLWFEGEYFNGKRLSGKLYDAKDNLYYDFENEKTNGLIKEYNYYGKLIFEGEYLDGKRNGKGKEYFYDGSLIFEGEYLKGKRNGKGKEFDHKGNLYFEGEYLNGKRWNGEGREYKYNGELLFEGEYLDGEKISNKNKNKSN